MNTTTTTTSDTTVKDTQKEAVAIDASTITTKINNDGTVTVSFRARAGWDYQYQINNTSLGNTSVQANKWVNIRTSAV